ncbi:2-hydroxyisoflavanone dehydratase-like [Senna tora]|uniref:2-hydroxyisoflavanone dehydratase-like n=1 Tax=Senna tora TaxID=362788 RepID=A0A834X2Q4_9FABA|nr:2-hydroxyisoflavanone dehydratase-like [Senna tora]
MDSTTATHGKEMVSEIPTYIRVFNDGTVERPRQAPFVPPSLQHPNTPLSSKDILISHNPSISARLYLPNSILPTKLPILLYFHGGGFFFESAFSQLYHSHFTAFLSHLHLLVVSVDYRLAPEHPLPAAYDDCWASLQWLASHFTPNNPTNSDQWLIDHGDSTRIFIGGDSAGGNIVHNIAMRAGSEALPGGVKILGAIYSHPYFYSSQPIGSEPRDIDNEKSFLGLVWKLVYPSAPGGIDSFVINPMAPGAPSLAGLGCSKMLICVAGKDKLRDRGVWYYEGVKQSGWEGKLELFEEEGEDHVYHIFNPESENGKKMIQRLASFIFE